MEKRPHMNGCVLLALLQCDVRCSVCKCNGAAQLVQWNIKHTRLLVAVNPVGFEAMRIWLV